MQAAPNTEASSGKKRARLLWGVGCGAVITIGSIWLGTPEEPAYHGKTITNWLRNYGDYKQKDWREAESALRAFGTNGVPYIMKEFTRSTTSTPFWKRAYVWIWHSGPTRLRTRLDPPNAWRFDTSYAPEVFGAIGPQSIPLLIEALNDGDPTVRIAAAKGLGWFGPAAKPALERLKICLMKAGTNPYEREAVSNAIAQIDPDTTTESGDAKRHENAYQPNQNGITNGSQPFRSDSNSPASDGRR